MRQVGVENYALIPPLQVRHHEEILSGVAPKQMLGNVANGEGVRPTDAFRNDVRSIRSVLKQGSMTS